MTSFCDWQATQVPDRAVRWNCKAGKCGSCSAEINGKPKLMCMARMSALRESETVTVLPMRTFPVIKDLVTDVSFNYVKAREIPAFHPPEELAPGEYRMQQIDVQRSQEFRKCIECFLCQNTCHVIRDHEDNKQAFSGPRYLMRVAELEMHPLDSYEETGANRAEDAHSDGLGFCNITKCCTNICPGWSRSWPTPKTNHRGLVDVSLCTPAARAEASADAAEVWLPWSRAFDKT